MWMTNSQVTLLMYSRRTIESAKPGWQRKQPGIVEETSYHKLLVPPLIIQMINRKWTYTISFQSYQKMIKEMMMMKT